MAGLRELLKHICDRGDAFDEEDRCVVTEEIATRESELQKLLEECGRQDSLRREKEILFQQLYGTLNTRSKLLDDLDSTHGVLKDHENVLRFFAKKQVMLANLLKEKMQQLVPP